MLAFLRIARRGVVAGGGLVVLRFLGGTERRDLLDGVDDLFRGDEARALEMAVGPLVARAPQEIVMVEVLFKKIDRF